MLIPADDRGFTLGVGLFETLLVIDGVPQFWAGHMDRLARGCAQLGLPAPDADACGAAAAAVLTRKGREALRLSWTGGSGARGLAAPPSPRPRLIATAAPAPPVPATLSLATVGVRRNPSSLTSRLKTLSYLDNVQARQAAAAAGADEALMLNTGGHLACAAAANLFWFRGDTLCTPALDCGVLDGIMRAAVLAEARAAGRPVEEIEGPPSVLATCDGAFLTSSLIGAVPVAAVDGKPYSAAILARSRSATSAVVRAISAP